MDLAAIREKVILNDMVYLADTSLHYRSAVVIVNRKQYVVKLFKHNVDPVIKQEIIEHTRLPLLDNVERVFYIYDLDCIVHKHAPYTLKTILRTKFFSTSQYKTIFKHIMYGLQNLHMNGIVCSNLSCNNILIHKRNYFSLYNNYDKSVVHIVDYLSPISVYRYTNCPSTVYDNTFDVAKLYEIYQALVSAYRLILPNGMRCAKLEFHWRPDIFTIFRDSDIINTLEIPKSASMYFPDYVFIKSIPIPKTDANVYIYESRREALCVYYKVVGTGSATISALVYIQYGNVIYTCHKVVNAQFSDIDPHITLYPIRRNPISSIGEVAYTVVNN